MSRVRDHTVHTDTLADHLRIRAAKIGMSFLRCGHSAVDAVEMAIKALEDNPITNAGYGSNLTIEGDVECDATIVDHYGRSGAAGAVSSESKPSVKLAPTILTCCRS